MRATWTDRRWNGLLMAALLLAAWACADDGEGCDIDSCLGCDDDGGVAEPEFPYPDDGPLVPGGVQIHVTERGLELLEEAVEELVPLLLGEDGLSFCFPQTTASGATICGNETCSDGQTGCQLNLTLEGASLTPRAPDQLDVQVRIASFDRTVRARLLATNCNARIRFNRVIANLPIRFLLSEQNVFERTQLAVSDPTATIQNLRIDVSGGFVCFIADLLSGLFSGAINDAIGDALGEITEVLPEEVGAEGAFDLGDLLGGLLGGDGDDEDDTPAPPVDPRLLFYSAYLGGYASAEGPESPQSLSLGMLAGTTADPDLCVPVLPPPITGPIPPSPTLHTDVDPAQRPFSLGIGIHREFLDLALWGVHRSGALCLELGAEDIEFLSTGVLGLLLPTLDRLGDGLERPLRIVLRPNLAPRVQLGEGAELVQLVLENTEIDFYLFHQDRYGRVLTLDVDLNIPIGIDVTSDGVLTPLLGDLGGILTRIEARNASLLTPAESQVLVELLPTVIGLLLPGLTDDALPSLELPDLFGFQLVLRPGSITSIDNGDLLAIFADLELTGDPIPLPMVALPAVDRHIARVDRPATEDIARHMADVREGTPFSLDAVRPVVHVTVPGDDLELGWRIGHGPWSVWHAGNTLRIDDRRLGAPGQHHVEVRARYADQPATLHPDTILIPVTTDFLAPRVRLETSGAQVHVIAHDDLTPAHRLARRVLVDGEPLGDFATDLTPIRLADHAGQRVTVTVEVRDEAGNIGRAEKRVEVPGLRSERAVAGGDPLAAVPRAGCSAAGAPTSGPLASLLLLAGLLVLRRRRGLLAVAAAALLLGACGSDSATTPPAGSSEESSGIETTTGPECQVDLECGTGERCVDGACVTVDCRDDFDCGDLQVCRDFTCHDLDLGRACEGPADCSADEACVAGHCTPRPPECVTNNMCPDDLRCEDNRCVPPPAPPECFDDADCGEGLVCRARECVPGADAPECIVNTDCPAGERCVGNSCEPVACTSSAECTDPCENGEIGQCFDGDCFCGVPCADGCPAGTFCCHDTDRCTPEPWACSSTTCPAGTQPVVRSAATASSRTCALDSPGECECVPLPPLDEGRIGRWLTSASHGDQFAVAAWNETYGDLAVGFVGNDGAIAWETVDGLPAGARASADPAGPRSGIADPGPDAGHHPSLAFAPDGTLHATWHVASGPHALTLRHGVRDASGQWTIRTVDADGGGGLYGELHVTEDGTPWVFYMAPRVADSAGAWRSELRAARAGTDGDYDISVVHGIPNTEACGGRCPTGEACNADTNACTRTISERWCGGCPGDQACFRTDSPDTFTCAPVTAHEGIVTLPAGTGLFASALRENDGFRVVFHDAVAGTLLQARVLDDGTSTPATTIAGTADIDAGRFATAGTVAGEPWAAFVDETRRELVALQLDTNLSVLVDDGVRITDDGVLLSRVGQAVQLVDCGSSAALVYQDATSGTLVASVFDNGWLEPVTLGGASPEWDGAWGFYIGVGPRSGASVQLASSTLFNEGNDVRVRSAELCPAE